MPSKKGSSRKSLSVDKAPKKEQIFKNAAVRDGFDNFVSRLGLNNDNTLSAGTYVYNLVTRNRILLETAYRGSWVVGAVVDSVAEDMTRAGIEITTSEQDEKVSEIQSAISKLQLWQAICTNEKWGRLYGGSIAVIQIEGHDLATPLDPLTVAKDQFKGLTVYDRWQLNPILNPLIDSGPNMGLPRYYQIVTDVVSESDFGQKGTFITGNAITGLINVHHSRVLRSDGIKLPYFQAITEMLWGESILERMWDRLVSFDNATLSAASLIDRANLRTVGIENLREVIAAGGDAYEGLLQSFEMMRQMQVNEGLTLLDKNDTFASTAYSFAGLSDMLLQFGQQLSGASEIPLTRLFGQSPAGLGDTGDSVLRTYYDSIKAKQEAKLRVPMETLLKILWRSTFGQSSPDDLQFQFTPLWQMSSTDKAQNAKTITETVVGAYESGLTDRATALKELRDASADTGTFSNITDEQINEAENEDPPLPDQDPNAPDPSTDPSTKPVKSFGGDSKPWYKRWLTKR
jgi:hypothetical protein